MALLLRSQHPNQESRRDLALEGLRGFCALLVVCGHMTAGRGLDPGFGPTLLQINYSQAAVLVFFVISGYVIGLTVKAPATSANVRQYCVNRLVRIVPIAWIAVLLSVALVPAAPKTVIANLLFVQNNYTYPFGLSLPVLPNNVALWSLSCEMLYYGLFILIWRFQPRVGTVVISMIVVSLAHFAGLSLAISAYAYYFCFWLSGLCIAWYCSSADDITRSTWITALAGSLALWTIGPLDTLLQWVSPIPIGFPYRRFDFLLGAVSVVLAVINRAPRLQARLSDACIMLGVGVIVLRELNGVPNSQGELIAGCVLVICFLLRGRSYPLRPLAVIAPIGTISYALYATSDPILRLIYDAKFLIMGSALSFGIRVMLWAVLCGGTAWILERQFYPWLRKRINFRRQ